MIDPLQQTFACIIPCSGCARPHVRSVKISPLHLRYDVLTAKAVVRNLTVALRLDSDSLRNDLSRNLITSDCSSQLLCLYHGVSLPLKMAQSQCKPRQSLSDRVTYFWILVASLFETREEYRRFERAGSTLAFRPSRSMGHSIYT